MIARDDITAIGKFNKAHGINGEISASVNMPLGALSKCFCIVCDIDGIFVPFFIKDIRNKSHDSILISVEDINNEDDALLLVNKDIYVMRKDYNQVIDDEDELPLDFLIGFKANINSTLQGTIVDIDDSTSNVLFVIDLDSDKELLVPVADEFISNIDNKNRLIEMIVPSELLEL